jgi:hypothetical protein
MFIRTISAAKAMTPLFFAFTLTATAASSQNYHHKMPLSQIAGALDSVAAPQLQVSVQQLTTDGMKFRIAVMDAAEHTVMITIKGGGNDEILYERTLGKAPFESIFNLSDLEDGNYQVLISCGKEKITKTIHIQTQTKVDRRLSIN